MPTIQQLVAEQQNNLHSLLDVLKQEQQAIAGRNSQLIGDYAKAKSTLIDKIKLTDYQLSSHTDSTSLSSDEVLINQVNTMRMTLNECNTLNEINGEGLIRAQRTFHKLNNMLQQSRGKQQMTYNSEGQAINTNTLGTDLIA